MRINPVTLAHAHSTGTVPVNPWAVPEPFAGAGPGGNPDMAMDRMIGGLGNMYAGLIEGGGFSEGIGFLGYPYLAELSQRPEYRHVTGIWSLESTRKWIKLAGCDEAKLDLLQKALEKFQVKARIREAIEHDGFFGRAQIYIDVGTGDDAVELRAPLLMIPAKIGKGQLKGFKNIEPVWSYPGLYEATNPLSPTFYRPEQWQIQSMRVHATRLLTLVGREMPDLLKPAYAFGGLSLSQMIKPYVDNWLRTRQSVSDLLHSFSTMVLKTNMAASLTGLVDDSLVTRAEMYSLFRDNRGLLLVDKDTEELENVSTPLGTLDKLQAQAQEQIASVSRIPLVVLLGVTPSGLNASSDGEIAAFHAAIGGYQERVVRPPLHAMIEAVQLNEFGSIDPTITFTFEKLADTNEAEAAANRKSDADVDGAYITAGVISPDEARHRVNNDEGSRYFGQLAGGASEMEPDDGTIDDVKGAADEWAGAADEQHWITAHPNGEDGEGRPVLIEGNADGGYTIVGGAGGKLDGKVVHPGSMSGPHKGKDDPSKKHAQAAKKPDEANAGPHADHLSETAKTHEEHQAAIDAHRAALIASGDDAAKRAHHSAKMIHHIEEKGKIASATATDDADAASAGAKTIEDHRNASALHGDASDKAAAAGDNKRSQRHRLAEAAHAVSADKLEHGDDILSKRAHEATKPALAAVKGMKTIDQANEANRLVGLALNAHSKAREDAYARGDLQAVKDHDEARRSLYKPLRSTEAKATSLAKKDRAATFAGTDVGKSVASIEKRFEKGTAPEIHNRLKEDYGLNLINGSNAARDYARAKSALKKGYKDRLPAEELEALRTKANELYSAAANTNGARIRRHTEYDIDDGSPASKVARRTMGHVADALDHLQASGYDIKSALSRGNVAYQPGNVGKSVGHAFQRGGIGHFTLSSGKTNAEFLIDQVKLAEQRAANGKPKWTISSAEPPDQRLRATAIHELAHALGMQPHIGSPAKLAKLLDAKFVSADPASARAARQDWIKSNISEYAASNIHETDAELATLVTSASYVSGTLPPEFEAHVHDLFHKRKDG